MHAWNFDIQKTRDGRSLVDKNRFQYYKSPIAKSTEVLRDQGKNAWNLDIQKTRDGISLVDKNHFQYYKSPIAKSTEVLRVQEIQRILYALLFHSLLVC